MRPHPFIILSEHPDQKVEWCPYCGCVSRETEGEGGRVVQVFFPKAHEKASQTVCARLREEEQRGKS